MKVLHVNAGNEYGGGLFHILSIFQGISQLEMDLLVFEDGPVAEMARKNGINVFILPQKSRYDLTILSRLKSFINDREYTILHTHGPRANLLISLIRRRLAAKWVMTVHSDPTLDFKDRGIKGRIFEILNLHTIKKTDRVIAVSSEIKEILVNNRVPTDDITVVHNGRNFNLTPSEISKVSDRLNIVTVGRLEWVKGHKYLLQALGKTKHPDWHLTICGAGQEERSLKILADELHLSKKINFLGWVDSLEVSKQIAQADVMVLPSLSESFPLVALEAAENHIPVIATEVGDVKNMIPDKSMGWIVQKASSDELAAAIEEAYADWKTNTLKQKGKHFFNWSSQFTIQKQGLETMKVYQKCLKSEK